MIGRPTLAAALLLSTLSAGLAGEGGGLNPASGAEPRLSRADRAAIVDELVERLRADPEILVETLLRYNRAEKADTGLGLVPSDAPIDGLADAATTVVEFVDYTCEPCRNTARTLDGMARSGEIRLVHRDLPFGGVGVRLAVSALDAHKRAGRYDAVRSALLADPTPPSGIVEDRAFALAVMKRARADAARLGIRSLPALVVVRDGRMEILSGEVGRDAILAASKRLAGEG